MINLLIATVTSVIGGHLSAVTVAPLQSKPQANPGSRGSFSIVDGEDKLFDVSNVSAPIKEAGETNAVLANHRDRVLNLGKA